MTEDRWEAFLISIVVGLAIAWWLLRYSVRRERLNRERPQPYRYRGCDHCGVTPCGCGATGNAWDAKGPVYRRGELHRRPWPPPPKPPARKYP